MTNKSGSARSLANFTPYLTRQAGRVAAAYGISVVGVILTLMLPWPLKFMIDDVLSGAGQFALLQVFSVQQQVIVLAVAMAILASLVAIVLAADKILHAKVRERFSYCLRDDLLQQLYRLSRPSRQKEMSGELTMRLVSDTQQVSRLFCKTFPMTLKHIITAVLALVAIMLINVLIGLVALLMAGVLAGIVLVYGPRLNAAAAKKRDREGRVSALTQQTVNGIEHVQAMALEEQARTRYLDVAASSLHAGVDETRVAVSLERSSQYIAGLALALVAGVGGIAVVDGNLSLGTLTVCLAYMAQLLKPIEKINQVATSISRGMVRADRIRKLFLADVVVDVSAGKLAPQRIQQIDCTDLSFRYEGHTQDTITGFNRYFRMGECTFVIGPSGCGKSTLLRLILGLQSPTSGKISVNGQDYNDVDARALRSQFAVLLQDAHLFAGSIREILTELRPGASDAQIEQVLAEVRLLDLVNALRDGLDTQIDEAGTKISGGQRARLLLARALISGRPVLILDEPFANLDSASRRIIQRRIAVAKRDHIVIVVSHEKAFVNMADRVVTQVDFQDEPTDGQLSANAMRSSLCQLI